MLLLVVFLFADKERVQMFWPEGTSAAQTTLTQRRLLVLLILTVVSH